MESLLCGDWEGAELAADDAASPPGFFDAQPTWEPSANTIAIGMATRANLGPDPQLMVVMCRVIVGKLITTWWRWVANVDQILVDELAEHVRRSLDENSHQLSRRCV